MGMGRWARRRGARIGCAAVVAAGLLSACEIELPVQTIVEGATSAVSLQAMNEAGSHVVVRATGAGATVPGPGLWLVERSSGEAVELVGMPATGDVVVSSDGSRVLVRSSSAVALWDDGVVTGYPSDAVFSDDLRQVLTVGASGTVERTDLVAGTPPVDVEAGVPRPVGLTLTRPGGVSDDGTVVHFTMRPAPGVRAAPVQRLLHVPTGTATDRPAADTEDTLDRFRLAAEGTAFVHHHEELWIDWSLLETVVGVSWFDVLDPATGSVLVHHDVKAASPFSGGVSDIEVSDVGRTVWYRQERASDQCPGGPHAVTFICVVASQTTAVHDGHVTTWNTGAGAADGLELTSSGRFAAVSAERFAIHIDPATWGPAYVLDRLTEHREDLGPGEVVTTSLGLRTVSPVRPHIADGGQLVATASSLDGRGWYEYTPAPEDEAPPG